MGAGHIATTPLSPYCTHQFGFAEPLHFHIREGLNNSWILTNLPCSGGCMPAPPTVINSVEYGTMGISWMVCFPSGSILPSQLESYSNVFAPLDMSSPLSCHDPPVLFRLSSWLHLIRRATAFSKSVGYHLETIFLFTKSDITTTLIPIVGFLRPSSMPYLF